MHRWDEELRKYLFTSDAIVGLEEGEKDSL